MLITDFLKYVLPAVPGCPTAVAKQAVMEAVEEFLTNSQAWNEVQDPVPVAANVQEYDLEAPTGGRCIDIRAIYTLAGELVPKTIEQLAHALPAWQTAEGSVPHFYTRAFDFTTFRVYPMPIDPGEETMRVHGVYTLKDTATAINDELVYRYRQAFADGAKAILMKQPKTTWQDLKLSAHHRDEFETAMSMAKITAAHGKTAGAISVRPRKFGQ
jgi:hypothetical protein